MSAEKKRRDKERVVLVFIYRFGKQCEIKSNEKSRGNNAINELLNLSDIFR